MIRSILAAFKSHVHGLIAGVLGCTLALGTAAAQAPAPTSLPAPTTEAAPAAASPIVDPNVQQTSGGCASCNLPPTSGGLLSYGGGCSSCGSGTCYPGRKACDIPCDTVFGRLFGGLCEELCCPDPCYEPSWIPAANAAFFQDSPRPVTQTRIGWDAGFHYNFPDTSEFFWKNIGSTAKGTVGGPSFTSFPNAMPSVNYDALRFYQEVAAKNASMFIDIPYYSMEDPGRAGFGDMNIGAKTVLLDRDLILVSMQFKTYIPIGVPANGTSTGHVSLEPALLTALKLTSCTYLQMELAEWIPLGGTAGVASSVFHYHFSLNQNLCHYGECLNVVGTAEFNGYSFQGGYSTINPDGTIAEHPISGSSFYSAGPGVRVQFCNCCDFGVGMAFGFGDRHGPDQLYRTELRIRY